ncbi:MAG: hypothetical protein N2712_05885 [Brevinematales bacterium]|nr:hypothetical protein [Brevinematales bacterium]
MKRFYLVVMMLILASILIFSVIQKQYFKNLCKEEEMLNRKISYLKDEYFKTISEIEKLTTIEKLLDKNQNYKVSLNKVIIIKGKQP